ncbi:hypothetical protein GB937_002928 [Aspergillus fischeri]|nr:hypothetical protein GB937_002928 [Aspergillus fischeri]
MGGGLAPVSAWLTPPGPPPRDQQASDHYLGQPHPRGTQCSGPDANWADGPRLPWTAWLVLSTSQLIYLAEATQLAWLKSSAPAAFTPTGAVLPPAAPACYQAALSGGGAPETLAGLGTCDIRMGQRLSSGLGLYGHLGRRKGIYGGSKDCKVALTDFGPGRHGSTGSMA